MEDAALRCGTSLWTGNDRAESPRREAMRTCSSQRFDGKLSH